MEREDRRRGKSRQDHDGLPVHGSQADRLAGLEGDPVDDDPRLRAERAPGSRGPPPPCWFPPLKSSKSLGCETAVQGLLQASFVVPHDAERDRLGPELADGVGDQGRVGVIDRGGTERLARRDDLIAGRNDRDSRLANDRDAPHPDRGQDARLARREDGPAAHDPFSPRDVGARERDPRPRRDRPDHVQRLARRQTHARSSPRHQHPAGPRRRSRSTSPTLAQPASEGRLRSSTSSELIASKRGVSSAAPKVSSAWTAKPSRFERSNGGTSTAATTSAASTRPSAAARLTSSVASTSGRSNDHHRRSAVSRSTTSRNCSCSRAIRETSPACAAACRLASRPSGTAVAGQAFWSDVRLERLTYVCATRSADPVRGILRLGSTPAK